LKLTVLPQETSVAVVTFPTIRDAAAAASKIMRAGVPIAAMEIMDDVQMRVVNHAGATKRRWDEVPTMFFKYVLPMQLCLYVLMCCVGFRELRLVQVFLTMHFDVETDGCERSTKTLG